MGSARSQTPWALFAALSLGMIVFGLAESYGPLTVVSKVVPQSYSWLAFSLPFIFGGIGALVAGYLADALGRKTAFMVAAGLTVLGLALYTPVLFNVVSFSTPVGMVLTIASMALVGMAAIGIESPVLTMIAESVSPEQRSKLLVLAPNFGNLGVALAFVPALIVGITSSSAQSVENEVAILMMYLGPLAALVIAWLKATESLPWRAVKGSGNVIEAWRQIDGGAEGVVPTAGLGLRILTLLVLGIAQDVAFVFFTYDAPGSFTSAGPLASIGMSTLVPLIGGFVMTVVGVITGLWISTRLNRRTFAVLSFGLMALGWAVLAITGFATGFAANYAALAAFVFIMVPLELTWAARALLEPELFPTSRRGLYVSLIRMSVWVVTGLIMIPLSGMALTQAAELASVSVIMAAGVAGALVWRFKGFETANRSLYTLDLHAVPGPRVAAGDPGNPDPKE